MDTQTIINSLTPLVGPALTAGVKKILPFVPSWALPIIATALGALFNGITTYAATNQTPNIYLAAALGLAGIGVREIKDQISPAEPKTPPTP